MTTEPFLFGDKDIFAIEVKPYKAPKKFYLRIWFYDSPFGSFKRGGSLEYIVNSYFKTVLHLQDLYEPKFNRFSDQEIFDDIVFDMSVERTSDQEERLIERMNKYCLELGDYQFTDCTFIVLNLSSENKVKLLIYHNDAETPPQLFS